MTTGNADRAVNGDCKCATGAVNNDGFSCLKCNDDYILDGKICKPRCKELTITP